MNGRTEHKIKIEKKTEEKFEDNKFYLKGFYNYMSSKYEYKTKEVYLNYVERFMEKVNKPVESIEVDDIIEYLNSLEYKKGKNDEMIETSGTYRATTHSALKLYFTYLFDTKKVKMNIMETVPRPKNKKNNQINRVYLQIRGSKN